MSLIEEESIERHSNLTNDVHDVDDCHFQIDMITHNGNTENPKGQSMGMDRDNSLQETPNFFQTPITLLHVVFRCCKLSLWKITTPR